MKSRYTTTYQNFLAQIKSLRLSAGLTQQQVADALGRPQSFVAKYENGERRIDVVEFVEICEVIGIKPSTAIDELLASSNTYKFIQKNKK